MAATRRTAAVTRVTPILRSADALAAARWYERLGFVTHVVYEPEPGEPRFVTVRAGDLWLFLSEFEGDASPDTLIYLHVDDIDAMAARLGLLAEDMPWGMREVHLTDPDGNRIRVGAGIA
jgi:catechol 2,3-dioxygenase-like lactoylglutathione lyase family enzyme